MQEKDFLTLVKKISPAIVTINSLYLNPDPKNLPNDKYICLAGSGFLIDYKCEIYVVTSAHVVLVSTVDDPVDMIYCSVYSVNGDPNNNQMYNMKLIGVDGLADIAVGKLEVRSYDKLPQVGKHSTISLEDNLLVPSGTSVFNISNPLNKDLWSVSRGTLRDSKYFDPSGNYINGCITTSCPVYASGSPIINVETGKCLGIVRFGFIDPSNVTTAAFSGGCGSHTLKIISKNILRKKHVSTITAKDKTYFSNRKGWLGELRFSAVMATMFMLNPQDFRIPKLNGMVLKIIPENSPLNNPIKGQKLNSGDIIVSMTDKKGNTIPIGAAEQLYAAGIPLWTYDPEDSPKKSKLVVLRRTETGYHDPEYIEIDLNLIIPPSIERPPQSNTPLALSDCDACFFCFAAFLFLSGGCFVACSVGLDCD